MQKLATKNMRFITMISFIFKGRLAFLTAIFIGIPFGLGLFILFYAEAFSYSSSKPGVCANCHIMNSPFDSWQKSSHHNTATCVECHLPHDLIGKYFAKAMNGYHHSKAFTTQDFHEPIMIKPGNSRILQHNCIRCHSDLVHSLGAGIGPDAVQCVLCHRNAGHGDRVGLGSPQRITKETP